jgi:hypothetical protein
MNLIQRNSSLSNTTRSHTWVSSSSQNLTPKILSTLMQKKEKDIRVFREVRKTRHQYPEFGPKPGEIQKKSAKRCISTFNRGGSNSEMHHFLCQTEFHPVLTHLSFFFLGTPPLLLHIFSLLLHVQLL